MVESDFALCGACWRETPFIGGTVCAGCGTPLMGPTDDFRAECDECMQAARPWDAGRSAMLYSGIARKLVLALKHGDRQEIARPAARWLAQAARPIVEPDMIVAPVPLHWSRLLKRRYNQTALLSQALARLLSLDHCADLLCRYRRTASLDGKTPQERMDELAGSIYVNTRHKTLIQDRPILLIDDVMTSGATFTACTQACQEAGAGKVRVLALARVAFDT